MWDNIVPKEDMKMTLEEKLRELILNKYGTVTALSKAIGLSPSTVYSILSRGLNNASVQNVLKICDALDISADALAEGLITPKDQFTLSIDLNDWLLAEKLNISNVNLTIGGRPLTDSEKSLLWDSLKMAANFIQKVKP